MDDITIKIFPRTFRGNYFHMCTIQKPTNVNTHVHGFQCYCNIYYKAKLYTPYTQNLLRSHLSLVSESSSRNWGISEMIIKKARKSQRILKSEKKGVAQTAKRFALEQSLRAACALLWNQVHSIDAFGHCRCGILNGATYHGIENA